MGGYAVKRPSGKAALQLRGHLALIPADLIPVVEDEV
jgi:hypothetical protein